MLGKFEASQCFSCGLSLSTMYFEQYILCRRVNSLLDKHGGTLGNKHDEIEEKETI